MPNEWKRFNRLTTLRPLISNNLGITCSSIIFLISRGTPGVKKKRALPILIAKPQAVPIGLSMNSAPSGNMACFLLLGGIVRPLRS